MRFFALSDLGRIQTCNLLSRNQMRYSVAPRGRFVSESTIVRIGVQIYFFLLLRQNIGMDFKKFIRDIPDFPSKGVVFKDITPLLKNAEALQASTQALLNLVEDRKIDKVVGMESRGFFYAPLLAKELNAGFVPVRKDGKLPATTIKNSYDLEYGTDTLEIHMDGIEKGDRILIHDDVLATGGTAKAVCEMIEELGGEIVQCVFLLELDFLKGAEKLKKYKHSSLLHY